MSLTVELIDRIERAVAFYGSGRQIPAAEAQERLGTLGVTVHEDYVEFLGRWGGCFDGTVRLADHDNGDVEILAATFSAFLAANVHD